MQEEMAIHWFRRDLRINDNPALYYALKSNYKVLPIFIFDTQILDKLEDKSDARVQFIRDTLVDIKATFEKLQSTISIFYGNPLDVFKTLAETYTIKEVFTNRDYEPYAKTRDSEVKSFLRSKSIQMLTFKDHVIFENNEITTDTGQLYKVFTPYKNKWLSKFETSSLEFFPSETLLHNLYKTKPLPTPTLAEMGFTSSLIKIPPTDFEESIIKSYDKNRDYPAKNGTTRLGIHLRFGTLSIRKSVKIAKKLNATWLNELIWRDFYSMVLAGNPEVVDKAFKSNYDQIPWRNAPDEFQKWCDGMTGYPIVDAGMRELNSTGYMHNRVRMVVASFLTKHLLIDWRLGEAYFAQKLLDFELASNNGGWQWAAGTGTDAQPYFRVFNPTSQAEKFDKEQQYINKWIPEYNTNKYPKPIVDHKFARERALKVYKEALNP
jgi:deoxyribodipyrimidine photo-lyase